MSGEPSAYCITIFSTLLSDWPIMTHRAMLYDLFIGAIGRFIAEYWNRLNFEKTYLEPSAVFGAYLIVIHIKSQLCCTESGQSPLINICTDKTIRKSINMALMSCELYSENDNSVEFTLKKNDYPLGNIIRENGLEPPITIQKDILYKLGLPSDYKLTITNDNINQISL